MTGSTYAPSMWSDVVASGVRPNIFGVKFTCVALSTTTLDTVIANDSLFRGAELLVPSAVFGDTVTLKIVDKDAVYAPANTVLSTPVSSFYMMTGQERQTYESICPFKIPGGVYFRIEYTATGIINIGFACNFILNTILF